MSEELKPCPFDGGTPEAVELWDAINRYANASRLSVQRQVAVAEIGSVLRAAWNRRASDAEVERLRGLLYEVAYAPITMEQSMARHTLNDRIRAALRGKEGT